MITVLGLPEVPYNVERWTYVTKPVYPVKINASQIPIGANETYVYTLEENHTYHVYCYGEWVDYNPYHNKTDYDIFVYNPVGEQVSYHTEAAGLPEHLGTTVDQPFFTPKHTGNYSFLIKNDPRESQGAKSATFMLIEHLQCNRWHKRYLHGKVNDQPVENTSWAYEFYTTSERVEVQIEVPDTLDMYEARLYLMANPSKKISVLLNDVPLAWEPGLYGELLSRTPTPYGGYNLNSRGFRHTDAMASCEYPGEDMLINYSSPYEGNILYHLVLIAEHGAGDVNFRIKTDFENPTLKILNPPKTVPPKNDTTITMFAEDNTSEVERAVLNYTTDGWTTWNSIGMASASNQTYVGTIPQQLAGTTVQYRIVAWDTVENSIEVQSNFTVKHPTNLSCSLSASTIYLGENLTVSGLITHGGAVVTLNYVCDNTTVSRLASANSSGFFMDVYKPNRTGLWTVLASWLGNETCFGASSVYKNFTVEKSPTSVTCDISREEVTVGENVSVTGFVEPVMKNMLITLIFVRPNGSIVERYVNVKPNGTFTADFQPDSIGFWRVQAKLESDNLQYQSSSSDLKSFTVNDTWINRYKFYVVGGAVALVVVAVVYVRKRK
ncbi:MAG: hypothetical protein U9O89_07395 [Thermoproteota archaeon]|nr:hypothetical protein [Thermoproteota archaeon]